MPIPLTGQQYEISAGDYRAVATELGAGLRELHYRGRPLLAGYEADQVPPGARGQLLLPWPNRIEGGHYEFGGQQLQLDLSEPAKQNAIHGLTRWANWAAADVAPDAVRLELVLHGRVGYPFCLRLEAEYRLDAERGLRVEVSAVNEGSTAAPFGTGQHPYLSAGPRVDDYELTLPAGRWLPVDERAIPSGPPEDVTGTRFDLRDGVHLGEMKLDHAFTGVSRGEDGRAWVRLAGPDGGLRMWVGDGYGWLQVFTGDTLPPEHRRRAIAIEPMTCPANAFVTGTDLIVLEPGETSRHAWGLEAVDG